MVPQAGPRKARTSWYVARSISRTVLVDQTLTQYHLEAVLDTAQLLTSEAVTNAVTHAHTSSTLRLRIIDDVIRISVTDAGHGGIVVRTPTLRHWEWSWSLHRQADGAELGNSADSLGSRDLVRSTRALTLHSASPRNNGHRARLRRGRRGT